MSTITGTVTNEVTLGTGTYTSPLTIAGTGAVTVGSVAAIYGPNTQAWTVANYGTVRNSSGFGVELLHGGSVTNSGTGLIQGSEGVSITGGVGTITNSGTINGTSGAGIDLGAGGYVGNSGTIRGADAVTITGGVGTVTNSGTIISSVSGEDFSRPVYLAAGGSVYNTGTIRGGIYAVEITGSAGTITNSGTIIGDFAPGGAGIVLRAGGSIDNQAGLIQGSVIIYGTGAVINGGEIFSTIRRGVQLNDGGSISNSGTISGANAIVISGGIGAVTNYGTILGGPGGGVDLNAGGTISNMGLIQGGDDISVDGGAGTLTNSGTILDTVELNAGGTVVNSGMIAGATLGVAITFGSTGNLLVLEHGYSLSGSAYGGTGPTNTIELSGALGAVTVNYNGHPLTNFEDVLFGGAGSETLLITNNTTLPGTISGFTLTSDIVDLTQVGSNATLANGGTLSFSHQLTASGSGGTVVLQLDATDATVFKAASDLGTGIDITPACFCRGTLIWTESGEVAVEDLEIGDRVVTLSGALRRVKWIGRRAYGGRFVAANRAVLPIRVAAGALAAGVPARDLFLSPEHALYIDGALVPAGLLVNRMTIRQVESVGRLEYFHLELERHDVILAEGAPAETFVDCDSRAMFQNADEFAELYPDDVPVPWDFCASRAEAGSAELAAIRAALAERSVVASELKLAS